MSDRQLLVWYQWISMLSALCRVWHLHGLGRHVVCAVNDTNARQAKVCQLDVPLAGDEQVVWLEITVDDSLQEQSQIGLSALLPCMTVCPARRCSQHT